MEEISHPCGIPVFQCSLISSSLMRFVSSLLTRRPQVQHILTDRALKQQYESKEDLDAEFERIKVRGGRTLTCTPTPAQNIPQYYYLSAWPPLSSAPAPSHASLFSLQALDLASDEAQEVVGRWFTQEHWDRISHTFVKDRSPADCQIYYRHSVAPQV